MGAAQHAAGLARTLDAAAAALDAALAAARPPSALPLVARHAEHLAAWHRAATAWAAAVEHPRPEVAPGGSRG